MIETLLAYAFMFWIAYLFLRRKTSKNTVIARAGECRVCARGFLVSENCCPSCLEAIKNIGSEFKEIKSLIKR